MNDVCPGRNRGHPEVSGDHVAGRVRGVRGGAGPAGRGVPRSAEGVGGGVHLRGREALWPPRPRPAVREVFGPGAGSHRPDLSGTAHACS